MENMPTIDFSPFMRDEGVAINAPPTSSQLSTASAINEAFTNHGFLLVSHLGITPSDLTSYFTMATSIFHLPESDKRTKLLRLHPSHNTGYSAHGSESLNSNRPADLKEAYNVRNLRTFSHDFSSLPPTVEPIFCQLWQKMEAVSQRFSLACALALDLPSDFFAQAIRSYDSCAIRLNYYPPDVYQPGISTGEDLSGALRVGEHTDFGMFTILFNDGPGLQVKAVEGGEIGGKVDGEIGGWVDVPVPGEDTAIVNTGALMARWTNDVWRATAHRVIIGSEEVSRAERVAIACFFDPDAEFVVDVHPKFVGGGEEVKYEPIRARDYLLMKLREAREN